METKKLSTEAYALHEFLLSMCVGKYQAIKGREIIQWLGIPSTRVLRKLREEINSNVSDIQRKVLTSSKGYYVAKQDDAVEQYREVAWRKIKQGVAMIKEGRRLLEHSHLDGQTRLKLSEYMKEVVEIASHD